MNQEQKTLLNSYRQQIKNNITKYKSPTSNFLGIYLNDDNKVSFRYARLSNNLADTYYITRKLQTRIAILNLEDLNTIDSQLDTLVS